MSKAATMSFAPVLLIALFLGSVCLANAAQSGTGGADTPRTCSPAFALVSPEFVVVHTPAQTFSFTMVGRCLEAGDLVFLVKDGTSIPLNLSAALKTGDSEQTVQGNATLSGDGNYDVCVAGAGAKDCSQPIGSGPTVAAMAPSSCSGKAIGPSLSKDLRSESPLANSKPPVALYACQRRPAQADKAVIVNAETGLTCTAEKPADPSGECSSGKEEKKPLQLRAGDTVRLYIVNKNPFLQNYKFSSTDSQITDDDIGTFLGLLVPGINGGGQKSSGGGANAAKDAVNTADSATADKTKFLQEQHFNDSSQVTSAVREAKGAQDVAENVLRSQITSDMALAQADLADSQTTKAELNAKESQIKNKKQPPKAKDINELVSLLNARMNDLKSVNEALEETTARANEVDACVSGLTNRIDNLVRNYGFFAQEYNRERNALLSGAPRCEDISNTATDLWKLISAEQAKIVDARMDLNLRDAMAAANGALANTPSPDASKHEPPSPARNTLNADLKSLTGAFCTLKAMRKEIAPVLNANAASIESVLINPNAFHSEVLIGPYADATQFDWTLQKTMTQSPVKSVDTASFNAAVDDCLSKGGDGDSTPEKQTPKSPKNPKTGGSDNSETQLRPQSLLINASFSAFSQIDTDAQDDSTQISAKKQKGKPTGEGNSAQIPKDQQSPSDSSTTTRGRRIDFGSERFIVSGGLTGSPLSLREFAKGVGQAFDASGKSITGQATANIITLKTDQSYRLSPMIFLNSRLHQWGGRAEALYATFGITAKSDSNGTAPEYMIGLSQSFLQRHLLLSAGAYAGRQQKLTGGLYLNEAIPPTLTGDIPTQSNYKFSAGFSISWRIPGLAK